MLSIHVKIVGGTSP